MRGGIRFLCVVQMVAPLAALADQPINCVERSKFVRHLADVYDEQPIAYSLTDGGKLIEFLFSKSRESWTIITTTPDGLACRVAAGKLWEIIRNEEIPSIY